MIGLYLITSYYAGAIFGFSMVQDIYFSGGKFPKSEFEPLRNLLELQMFLVIFMVTVALIWPLLLMKKILSHINA